MKNRFLAAILSMISVFIIFTFIMKAEDISNHSSVPMANRGILNLSRLDLNGQGIIKLDGEWEFYDGQLLKIGDLASDKYVENKQYINVPDKWNNYDLNRNSPGAFGYGTYHLKISLDRNTEKLYGLKTTNIGMSNQIWVNGVSVGKSGIPANTKDLYQMGNVPYTTYFYVDGDTIDLIVWVSNYDYTPYSGIVNSIFFGTQKNIQSFSDTQTIRDVIIISIFAFMSVTFLVFFHFMRRTYCMYSFIGMNFIAALFITNHSEKLLYRIIPNMDYSVFARLQYLTPGIFITLAITYFYFTYRSIFSTRITVALVSIAVALIPVCFIAPLSIQSVWSTYQMIYSLALFFYFVYMSMYGVIQKKEHAKFSLAESLSLFAMGIIAA